MIITYRFQCEHHQAVLMGEPEFSMSEKVYEWELDLSSMECPKMPNYPEEGTEKQIKEYDAEADACISSWNILQIRREDNLTHIKHLGADQ